MNSEDGQVYSVYCNFLLLLSTTVCSQNINKQNVNIADKTLTDYSFLSRYHYTKSKNYLKRRYRICHWIPMLIGTPCILYNYLDINCWRIKQNFSSIHPGIINIYTYLNIIIIIIIINFIFILRIIFIFVITIIK